MKVAKKSSISSFDKTRDSYKTNKSSPILIHFTPFIDKDERVTKQKTLILHYPKILEHRPSVTNHQPPMLRLNFWTVRLCLRQYVCSYY